MLTIRRSRPTGIDHFRGQPKILLTAGFIKSRVGKWGQKVIVENLIAPFFETNCWIIAPNINSECIVVDPGISDPNLMEPIKKTMKEKNLKPVAVLLTHGHLDHTFSVVPLADGYDIPALIHIKDKGALTNPYQVIMKGGPTEQIINSFGIRKFEEPKKVLTLIGEESIDLAGVKIKVIHSPGHTAGSTMFAVDENHLISGDVLFAGAIGRTDMPSGSIQDMKKTLVEKVLPLPDELIVLPGHGPQTTIARERRKNPYLQSDFLNQP